MVNHPNRSRSSSRSCAAATRSALPLNSMRSEREEMSAFVIGSIVMSKLSQMSGNRAQQVAWIVLAAVAVFAQLWVEVIR